MALSAPYDIEHGDQDSIHKAARRASNIVSIRSIKETRHRLLEVEARLIAYRCRWIPVDTSKVDALRQELKALLNATQAAENSPARMLLQD